MILDEVRWAQIGCGDVTEIKSGPAFDLIPHSRRVVVGARNAGRARDYAARHRVPTWVADGAAAIVHPEVNAVYIATPPDTHLHYTRLAAAAGHAILVEKPMARTVAEAEEMVAVCRAAGVPLFVAFYRRALPKFARVKSLIAAGAIGRPQQAYIRFSRPPLAADRCHEALPWRVQPELAGPGGYFMDMAPHQLDLLDWFFGPIESARGTGLNGAGLYPAVDHVVGHLDFAGGVWSIGSWNFAGPAPTVVDDTEIFGDEGSISFKTFDASSVRLESQRGNEHFDHPFPPHVHGPLIENIVASLRGEGECPCTGECGLRTQRALAGLLGLHAES